MAPTIVTIEIDLACAIFIACPPLAAPAPGRSSGIPTDKPAPSLRPEQTPLAVPAPGPAEASGEFPPGPELPSPARSRCPNRPALEPEMRSGRDAPGSPPG